MAAPPGPSSSVPAVGLSAAGRWTWFGAGMASASVLFLAYLLFLAPTPGVRVTSPPPRPTPPPAVVHVAGAVHQPGVYRLAASARVEEAIQLAGGATDEGNPAALNLAARVADGQRITVPLKATARAGGESGSLGELSAVAGTSAATEPDQPRRVNLNTASFAELDALPGVGPVTAQKILDQRQRAPFTSIEQLQELKLVNSATFARLRDLVGVD